MQPNGFFLFHNTFQFCLSYLYCKWIYDFFPDDEFTLMYDAYFVQSQFAANLYPPEYNPQSQRDRENRERMIAHYLNLLVHLDLAFQQSNGFALVHYFFKRIPPDKLQLRTVVYAAWYVDPELVVGLTDSLPIWLRGIGSVGWPTFIDYPKWCYDEGMDEEAREAIFEIRDGLRPWTLGNMRFPVPNDGHPGLLEIHRQLTNSEDLGVYYQPTLRDKVNESSCPDTVFVRVTVTGQRAESGDLVLPRGTQWPYNHYGQVRVRRLVDGAPFAVTAWQWIRSRNQVIGFTLPKKNPDANPGLVVDLPEYQAYGGLTVSASLL